MSRSNSSRIGGQDAAVRKRKSRHRSPAVDGQAERIGCRTQVNGSTLSTEAVSQTIGLIYDAALESTTWSPTLAKLAGLVHATSAVAFIVDLASADVGLNALAQIDPEAMTQYKAHFAGIDPFHRALTGMTTGRAYFSEEILDYDKFRRTEYCNDFFIRFGMFHTIGGFAFRDHTLAMLCGVQRPKARGPFDEAERRLIDTLFPHFARAARTHRQLAQACALQVSVSEAWDRINAGVLVVDLAGRVLWTNAKAQQLLAKDDGLGACSGHLRAASPEDTATLLGIIGCAVAGAMVDGSGSMSVRRPSLARPLALMAAPIRNGAGVLGIDVGHDRPAAVVFVSDPEERPEPLPEALGRLYGLTGAEARIAAAIAGGQQLKEFAEANGISIETARWELKQVMAKTDTHHQTDLVRLILTSPAGFVRKTGRD